MVSAASGELILAIETSHSQGSVAVADPTDPGSTAIEMFPPGLVHGREILSAIDRLFEKQGYERERIGKIAVSVGPGSYTGIRIGVAAAKALAFACDAELRGVSTLEVIAANVDRSGEFAVVLDARRGACYGARFQKQGSDLTRVTGDEVIPVEAFLESLPESTPLVGAGAGTLPGCDRFPRLEEKWNLPLASTVLERARLLFASRSEAPDAHALVPAYLRVSEAEEKLAARNARAAENTTGNGGV